MNRNYRNYKIIFIFKNRRDKFKDRELSIKLCNMKKMIKITIMKLKKLLKPELENQTLDRNWTKKKLKKIKRLNKSFKKKIK